MYSAVHAVRQHFASKNAEIKMKTMILRENIASNTITFALGYHWKFFNEEKTPVLNGHKTNVNMKAVNSLTGKAQH